MLFAWIHASPWCNGLKGSIDGARLEGITVGVGTEGAAI